MLSLVVPLYNEEGGVTEVATALVETMRGYGKPFELILVNNGSRDGTEAAIDRLAERYPEVRKAVVDVNQGYGWGVLNGLQAARGDYVGFMGGDGQIAAADVVRVWHKLLDENLPLCKARRIVRNDGPIRLVVTVLCNLLFRLLFPVRTDDINGTPKMMRTELYRQLNLQSKDWFLDAEVMIKCGRRRIPFGEVAVTFLVRRTGASHVRFSAITEFLSNIYRALRSDLR